MREGLGGSPHSQLEHPLLPGLLLISWNVFRACFLIWKVRAIQCHQSQMPAQLCHQMRLGSIPAPPLSSYRTVGQSLQRSVPQFLIYKMGEGGCGYECAGTLEVPKAGGCAGPCHYPVMVTPPSHLLPRSIANPVSEVGPVLVIITIGQTKKLRHRG